MWRLRTGPVVVVLILAPVRLPDEVGLYEVEKREKPVLEDPLLLRGIRRVSHAQGPVRITMRRLLRAVGEDLGHARSLWNRISTLRAS
jgi:hypothetical protein